jgi:hypothetical protein
MDALTTIDGPCTTPTIHIGVPTYLGGLTVFPAWTDQPKPRRALPTELPPGATITEVADGPLVDELILANPTDIAFLILEGLLVSGGWQHRVLTHSWLIGPKDQQVLEVRCVEQGRWQGAEGHAVDRRRAPISIRGALRPPSSSTADGDGTPRADQGEVWSRVHRYETAHGSSPTSSLVDVMDAVACSADVGAVPRALPGQRGVLVGVGGHPVILELFDHPRTLAAQLPRLVEGLLLDGMGEPKVQTPGRQARSFAVAASTRLLRPVHRAGVGALVECRDSLVDIRGLADQRNRLVHTAAVNVRHRLVAA